MLSTTASPELCSNGFQDAGVPSRKTAAGHGPHNRLQSAGSPAKSNKAPCLTSSPHPPLSLNSDDSEKLKQLLIDLSKDPKYASHRSTLRMAADQVRVTAFGYNRATTKRKIMKLVEEFHQLEIEDLVDETKIAENEIRAALLELTDEGKLKPGRRRRWQEPGKHYNAIFYLV
jgi:hypothetical protein